MPCVLGFTELAEKVKVAAVVVLERFLLFLRVQIDIKKYMCALCEGEDS